MKLQATIVLLLAVLIFFFTTVEYGILRLRIERYHREVEQDCAEANFHRAEALLQKERGSLSRLAQALVESGPALQHTVWQRDGLLGEQGVPLPYDFVALLQGPAVARMRVLFPDSSLPPACVSEAAERLGREVPPAGRDTSGFVVTECGSFLVALAQGEAGRVMVGRSLERLGTELAEPMQMRITFRAPGRGPWSPAVEVEEVDGELVARGGIAGVAGDQLQLEVASPKVFLARREQTLLLALLANTVVGLAIAFIVMALFQKLVITRINGLVEQVSAIRNAGDFASRVEVSGKDELGTLATAFNEALERLHQMAQRIEESEKRYASLVEQSRDGVAIVVEHTVRFANQRLLDMLGCPNLEQLARDGLAFLPEEVRGQVVGMPQLTGEGAVSPMPLTLHAYDGKEIEAELDVVHGTYEGQSALFLYLRDVSEKRRIERHLQRVDKLTSLGQLSSGIAHEIRTPLGSIQLNLDHLLQCTQLTDEQRHVVESSMEAVNRISSIVQRTLDFARPAEPSFEPTHVPHVVENVLKMMATNLRHARVAVTQQWEENLPAIQADGSQLSQAFVNIVLNAVQAMPRGGRLRIWGRRVRQGRSQAVEVGFEDTGIGIAPENLRRVFDPFFTTKHEGVGLGLSVVHRIMESHRATIDISSTPGKGTVVRIQFPVT
ncbi:MAG: ATP-binding protein [candidate division KSB1 bacterium]|nr:ATP-binding protein [candidate division KSB1 bacterium]